ncbi:hypothetical protein BBI17_006331 [Phytophthora kernoviae]|uniref:Uncharacterized protein n=2 Tax=Phytophthora kernoviae TaxID=325452 RepID=A0A3R7ILG9_9STRA|nr:hypothetical protein G195_007125 [Phytophthora kernoviae 00238/432]RLN32151.1 hypothetical protein BBI17_006331 [Phytophthora kernoviae]
MDNLTPLPDQELSPMQKKTTKPGEESNNTVSPPVKSSRLPADVRRARHRDRMQRLRLAEKRSIEVKRVEPIERSKCHELAFMGYQKMQEMLQGPGARKLHGEAFGWKVYFSFYEEAATDTLKIRMQHRFTKRISSIADDGTRVTGDTLASVTWNIINTPELYSQMYRSPMTSRIMQHVDAHTCVMMRMYPDENAEMRKRFVSLVVRVQDCVIDSTPGPMDLMGLSWKDVTRRRVTILSSILNPDLCLPRGSTDVPNPSTEWMREGFGYLSFTEIDDENVIEIEYGGSTNVGTETASCTGLPFVAMNMGEALVRDGRTTLGQMQVMSDVTSRERNSGQQNAQSKWPPVSQSELLFDAEVKIKDTEKKLCRLDEAKAARRRQRHKEVVARSRLKHKASTSAIQQEEADLGRKLHGLLEQAGHSVTPGVIAIPSQIHDDGTDRQLLQHKYVEQVTMQERIQVENGELRRRIEDHTKLYDAIDKELVLSETDTDSGGVIQVSTPGRPARGSGSWIFFEDDDDPFYFVPLSEKNCQEVMRAVYQRMLNLYSAFIQRRIPSSELEFFGWRVQQPVDVGPKVLRFQFTKTVRCLNDSMDSIVDRTWTAFNDPKQFATIYSTPVVTRIIQRVSRDMTMLIQNAPVEAGQERNIRYFNILARVRGFNAQRERIVALLKTIVNPSDCQGAGEVIPQLHEIEWMKRGISYLLLSEEPPTIQNQEARMIRLHYGCDYECVSEKHARYLMVEVLGIACRWEQLVMPSHCLTF